MHRYSALVAALALSAAPGLAASQETTVAEAEAGPSHPREVALVDEGPKGSVYRTFPTSLRLYVNDLDPPGSSICYRGCVGPWVPVYAAKGSRPVGDWQVLRRRDGKLQWMLDGKPVYTRFHDTAEEPTGDGIDGVWHLVPYTPKAENPAGRELTEK